MSRSRPPYAYPFFKGILKDSFSRHQWYILLLTFCCYAFYHMSRKPLSVVKSVLHGNCSVSKDTTTNTQLHSKTRSPSSECHWKPFDQDNWSQLLGSLEYAYLFSYAIAMFLSGHIAERTNLRYFLCCGMILSGIFTAAFGLGKVFEIHVFSYYLIVQIVAGLVQASGWPAVVTLLSHWFGRGRRGLIMGIWTSHTSVGNMLGSLVAGVYVAQNWSLSFLVPAFLIIIMGIITGIAAIPYPEDVGFAPPADADEPLLKASVSEEDPSEKSYPGNKAREEDKAISLWTALFLPGVLPYAVTLFFAKLVAYTFLYWLPNYLSGRGMSPQRAAQLSTIFDAGGILGGIAAGQISDAANSNRAGTCAAMLALAAPLLFMYQSVAASQSIHSLVLLFICGALVNGPYALITTAVSADLGSSVESTHSGRALATVTAIIDGMGSLGAALGPLLTGLIVPTGWSNVFYMLILSDVLALCMCLSILYQQRRQQMSRLRTVLGSSHPGQPKLVIIRQFVGSEQMLVSITLAVAILLVWILWQSAS